MPRLLGPFDEKHVRLGEALDQIPVVFTVLFGMWVAAEFSLLAGSSFSKSPLRKKRKKGRSCLGCITVWFGFGWRNTHQRPGYEQSRHVWPIQAAEQTLRGKRSEVE